MPQHDMLRSYLAGSIIIWAGIIVATAVILDGTDRFAQVLPILGGGALWFLVLIPAQLWRQWKADTGRQRYSQRSEREEVAARGLSIDS